MRFNKKAITNILILALVKEEYAVSYNGDAFIIHRANSGFSNMVFVPHPSGLHVYDPDDNQGFTNYSFVKTVKENMFKFTKRQVKAADVAQDLQAGLGFPSKQDFKWVVQSNQDKNCPVTREDVVVAEKIWGQNIATLKGKQCVAIPGGDTGRGSSAKRNSGAT